MAGFHISLLTCTSYEQKVHWQHDGYPHPSTFSLTPSSLSWKPERGGTKKQSNRREPWPFKHQQGSEGSFHPHHQPKLAYEDPAIAIQVPAVTTPRQASPCTSHRSRPTSAMTAGHIPSPHQSILMLSRLNCHLFLNSAFTQNERTPFEKLPEKYFRPGEFFPFVCVFKSIELLVMILSSSKYHCFMPLSLHGFRSLL